MAITPSNQSILTGQTIEFTSLISSAFWTISNNIGTLGTGSTVYKQLFTAVTIGTATIQASGTSWVMPLPNSITLLSNDNLQVNTSGSYIYINAAGRLTQVGDTLTVVYKYGVALFLRDNAHGNQIGVDYFGNYQGNGGGYLGGSCVDGDTLQWKMIVGNQIELRCNGVLKYTDAVAFNIDTSQDTLFVSYYTNPVGLIINKAVYAGSGIVGITSESTTITVYQGVTADFNIPSSVSYGTNNINVTNNSYGGSGTRTYSWSLDGSYYSNNLNIVLNNLSTGNHNVTLTATDSANNSTSLITKSIFVGILVGNSITSINTNTQYTTNIPSPVWTTNLGTISNSGLFTSSTAGTATITASNSNGSQTLVKTITVYASISSGFSFSPTNPIQGDVVTLTNTTTGGYGSFQYKWFLDDSDIPFSYERDTIISDLSKGTYTVKLVVIDGLNTSSTTIHNITVVYAPLVYRTANLTYTASGNTVNCQLKVIDPIRITNVKGKTLALQAGQKFKLQTNQNAVEWESVDCNGITISKSGLISVPYSVNSGCFGGFNCIIKGTLISDHCDLTDMPGATIYLNIKVNPYFPSRSLCGVPHIKWKREVPDFRVLVTEMEGGCDETHIRNKVPIYRWTIDFSNLPYDNGADCVFYPSRIGCDNTFACAKTLDDFFEAVAGQYGYFNLYDEETGELWQNCRFEKDMTKDHVNRSNNQSRSVSIVWKPCCATAPLGGACVIHYGFSPETNGLVTDGNIPVVDAGDYVVDNS